MCEYAIVRLGVGIYDETNVWAWKDCDFCGISSKVSAFMKANALTGIDNGVSEILDFFLVFIFPFHC